MRAPCWIVAAFLATPVSAAAPTARSGHAMAYEPRRHAVVMFGGTGAEPLGDLWAWDGRAWSQLSATGPAPRELSILAYDSRRRRLVLAGGRSRTATGSETLTDTWEWDGRAWNRREVVGPTPRVHAVGDFDAARGRLVVYGGVDDAGRTLTDTWEWDGGSWRQRSSAGPPGCLADHAAYDPTRRKVLMLCLQDSPSDPSGTLNSGLWEWDGTWQPVSGNGPTVQPVQPMASIGSRGLLLFDGRGGQGTSGYTWLWDRSHWVRRGGAGPPSRVAHAVAYDPERRRVVLFGGGNRTRELGDTWEWDGARWRRAAQP